ncbi:MAG: shufflon system plasmid conjugative transfer pilus tip adhesin PilV [Desulfovibrionales bacterium]
MTLFDKKGQAGFAILDVLMAIGIFALLLPGVVSFMQMTSQSTDQNAAASHMKSIATAAKQYVLDNHSNIVSSASATNSHGISLADLKNEGFLPSGYNGRNPWNQAYDIHAFNPEDADIHLVIITKEGRGSENTDFENRVVPAAASKLGAQGGYVPTGQVSGEDSSTLQGAYGGWNFSLSGTDISNPGAGHLAFSEYIDEEQFGSDYLYRDEVPGHPELNRMTTELDMDGNTILMGDGNVGGGNGEGVRKVNFENHEADDFSCSDHDDDGGSVFYDRNEGLFICRQGEKIKISDSMNSVAFKAANIVNNRSYVSKPQCSGGNTQGTTPRIYVVPAHFSANNSGADIKAVQSWADDAGSSWRVQMRVTTDRGYTYPTGTYGKLFVVTECQ